MNAEKKARIVFRDTSQRTLLVRVADDYEIKVVGEWLILPSAWVRASEILTVQLVTETTELKAA